MASIELRNPTESQPIEITHLLFQSASNIAAVTVVLARAGPRGFTDLVGRLIRGPVPIWTALVAMVFYPALMGAAHLAALGAGQPFPAPHIWMAAAVQAVNVGALLLGPLGEELGWRGFLLPRMLERMPALPAGLLVGLIWMVWHVPAFLLSGTPQAKLSFPLFALGGIALSLIVTWLFVNARGNVVIAGVVPHLCANAFSTAEGGMTWVDGIALAVFACALVLVFGSDLKAGPPDRKSA